MRTLAIVQIGVRDFRNLESFEAELVPGLNVVHGDNGHGKTSLLEAIYLAASSKSFRTAKLGEAVRHGHPIASVRIRIQERSLEGAHLDLEREQTAGLNGGRLLLRIDGQRPASRAHFALRTPMVVFHPDELQLSSGPAALRRRLLDRLVLYRDPAGRDALDRYGTALRARQELLRRGVRTGTALDAYEDIGATEGARLSRARSGAAAALAPPLAAAFARIAEPGLELGLRYAEGGSTDVEVARTRLASDRERDAHRASASFGPHRDDLDLRLGSHPARIVASQGQHRALVLALKAAESEVVEAATGLVPILLLDDVSSELDPSRTEALFAFLAANPSSREAPRQIILTTTRPDLVPDVFGEDVSGEKVPGETLSRGPRRGGSGGKGEVAPRRNFHLVRGLLHAVK